MNKNELLENIIKNYMDNLQDNKEVIESALYYYLNTYNEHSLKNILMGFTMDNLKNV